MERKIDGYKFLLWAWAFMPIWLCYAICSTAKADERPVALYISQEIKPFIEMVEGVEQALNHPSLRILFDGNRHPFSHDRQYKGEDVADYAYAVAVGPQALSYLVNRHFPPKPSPKSETERSNKEFKTLCSKILYAMVLNPERIIPETVPLCGISLDLFSQKNLSRIPNILPSVNKIGVLFDPENNSRWYDHARDTALFGAIDIVPLHIRDQSELKDIYQGGFSGVDALMFIPDQTITSPTLISHMIKEAIARKIPAIGYNRFFHRSGAAVSYLVDYAGVGEQMARMIQRLKDGEACRDETPAYRMEINEKVIELLEKK